MRHKKPILPTALHQRFSDVEQVRAEEALLDKCDVVIGGWSFKGNRFQVSRLVPKLSRLKVSCDDGSKTHLFEKRNADDGRYSHTIMVRGTGAGESVKYPYPMFSGYLKIREADNKKTEKSEQRNWEAVFYAYLNLNRAIQAQDLSLEAFIEDAHWSSWQPYALAISENAKSKIRERTFVPTDNMLDRGAKRTAYALSRPVERHFCDLVEAIYSKIRRELPSGRFGVAVRTSPTITLKTLEVCWDFFDEQPILTVLSIKNKVQSIAQRLKARYLSSYRLEEGLKYDSPSVMVDVVDGVAIRFYSKSETTVRFEVIYSQAAIKKTADLKGIQSLTEAATAIDDVKRDAATKLNNLLACLRDAESATESDASVDELVESVLGTANDFRTGVSLLTRLAYQHRIAPVPSDPQYFLLRALKRRGVLMNEPRSPRRRNYVVTPRFRRARDQLVSSYFVSPRASLGAKRRNRTRRVGG